MITDVTSIPDFGPHITSLNTQGIHGFDLVYDQESYELTIKVRYRSLNYFEAQHMGCYLQNCGITAAPTLCRCLQKLEQLATIIGKTGENTRGKKK
jgi:hypothetical protein